MFYIFIFDMKKKTIKSLSVKKIELNTTGVRPVLATISRQYIVMSFY